MSTIALPALLVLLGLLCRRSAESFQISRCHYYKSRMVLGRTMCRSLLLAFTSWWFWSDHITYQNWLASQKQWREWYAVMYNIF
ncbi:uncharacterized protein EV420DRAFT_1515725 [Desarmillaria tabescens]|uniref:Uncharacterized protein n=1 Tax=Armillaria tabescens TaxID=1929756 RepID=A0AA39T4K7_ARMTA|nr:uncharacterized protein EV420DRAFT_1515725 [Desarmillaria tabescens]KAK0464291.1 hypothetical protein EV420DRAFT_1515725 [Desarmillaria tabescens]